MDMPSTSPTDDLAVLDHIEAADQNDPGQETTDNPFQHVPEDTIRNLDSLMVEMPAVDEAAQRAVHIASEAARIRASRRMHSLEAEQLATIVPAIQGTPEAPISYTSVPTSVGVNRAVEILETEAENSIEIACNKASNCIDRAVNQSQLFISKYDKDITAANGTYIAARDACKAATGGFPEQNYEHFLGEEAAPKQLGRVAGSLNDDQPAGALSAYAKALEPLVGTAFDAAYLFKRPMMVKLGEYCYSLSDIAQGTLQQQREEGPHWNVTFATSLTAPLTTYPEASKLLQETISAATTQLSAIQVELDGHESAHDGEQVAKRGALVTRAALLISLVSQMEGMLTKIVGLTTAASQFYSECAKGRVVPGQERAVKRSAVLRRFF